MAWSFNLSKPTYKKTAYLSRLFCFLSSSLLGFISIFCHVTLRLIPT
ncbi:exported hypothetical protein [Vibrio harveyi]|nr:exported hypothetical protein [Vibrio harveyi]